MPNAYDDARTVEARGMQVLLPYLKERSDGLVLTGGGTLGRWLQHNAGDALFMQAGRTYSVEVKVEARHTGNAFLEHFSNRNLEDRQNHGDHGTRTGWLHALRADVLMCYYLDADWLYVLDLFEVKRWAFGHGETPGHLHLYPQVPQRKRVQRNDTWGHLVPFATLKAELPAGCVARTRVVQREMFERALLPAAMAPVAAYAAQGVAS